MLEIISAKDIYETEIVENINNINHVYKNEIDFMSKLIILDILEVL